MVRRLLASLFLVAFPVVVIPIAVTSIGARAGAAPPSAVPQCKDDGWQTLTDASGQLFKNQGQCISYFIHNPVSLADLAGSFSGTTSYVGGCSLAGSVVEQFFDATYPGSSAVGSVTLHLDGCVVFGAPSTYTGTFTIATSVGTLAGNANGPVYNVPVPPPPSPPSVPDFELTLSVLSETGALAGMTGTLHVSIQWPPPFGPPVTGSVTAP